MYDSHAHLTMLPTEEREDVVARARAAGVTEIVNICTDAPSLQAGFALAAKHPWIHNAAATTPHDVDQDGEAFFPVVTAAAREGKLVAIGETGLDYHYELSRRDTQKDFFVRYLHLAEETHLPCIVHCREAFTDFFDIVDKEFVVNGDTRRGLLHCFTGTYEEAQGLLARGWTLSFSGIVTYKSAAALREVVAKVPADRFLVETDTPYLAPQKYRGQRNEPAFIADTVSVVAQCRGVSVEEVVRLSTANAVAFFNRTIGHRTL